MNKAELESRADDALNDLIKDVGIVETIDILSKDAEEFVAIEKKLGEFLMGYYKSQEYLIDLYIARIKRIAAQIAHDISEKNKKYSRNGDYENFLIDSLSTKLHFSMQDATVYKTIQQEEIDALIRKLETMKEETINGF
jgi:hypothetical protein